MGHLLLSAAASAPDLGAAFQSALSTIQSQCMQYIGYALPVGLTVMGATLAIGIGVKAVKKFTH